MANFMGPMAPPQAAPQQPPQMDVKTSPTQRAQFKSFMRSMSAPTMPQVLPNIGMGVPSPDQTMAPMPSNPMMNVDIFSQPVQYMAAGGYAGSGMERGRGGTGMGDVGFSGAPSVSGPSIGSGEGGGSKNDALADILAPAPQQSFDMPPIDILQNALNIPSVGSNLPSPIQGAMNFMSQGVTMPGPMGLGTLNVQPTFSGGLSDPNLGIMGNYTLNFEDGGAVTVPKSSDVRGIPHKLAYITEEEAGILKALGGTGEMHKGIPAYVAGNVGGASSQAGDSDVGGSSSGFGNVSGGGGGGGRERSMEQEAELQSLMDSISADLNTKINEQDQQQDLADFQQDVFFDQLQSDLGIPPTTSAPPQVESDLSSLIDEAVQAENEQGAYGVSPIVGSLASYNDPVVEQVIDIFPDVDLAPMLDTPSYTTSIYDKAMTDLQKRANAQISGIPVAIPGTNINFKIPTSYDLLTTGIGSFMAGNIEDKIKAGGQPVYDENNKIIGVRHEGFLPGSTVYTGQNFPTENQGGREDVLSPLPLSQTQAANPCPPGYKLENGTCVPVSVAAETPATPTVTPAPSVLVPSTRQASPLGTFPVPQAAGFNPSQVLTPQFFQNMFTSQRPIGMRKGGSVIDAAADKFLGSLRAA